jgi:malate dehydrogenase (oxaloacetate-decarboxylating)(NADP+)
MNENYEKEFYQKRALDFHSKGRPGKIEVISSKPFSTASDLSLAYTPGVAYPCLEIAQNPIDVYKYTSKGNLIAVITNGTAVLGLGNIGPLAGKPVMEGKGILFKRFADIDVFDIEIDETSIDGMVKTIKSISPTFGGINLEDIKAPECFEIEERLIKELDIPVFHDDQHGTAIIASAAFLNAIFITKRKIEDVKVVFSGAGAAAIACAKLFITLGVKKENLLLCDSQGVIYKGRVDGMNKYKEYFIRETTCRTLADALNGADAFIGVSAEGVVSKEMVKSMAPSPIIFAMANPNPEIYPKDVFSVRDDAIMATGRSDFPNQVNNVLGFPFIFRGALDVRARKINDEMKMAAVKALAALAKEEVPEDVKAAYGDSEFQFGPNYLIPKPFDKRVLTRVTPAVAKAAIDSGVALIKDLDIEKYKDSLEERLGVGAGFIRRLRDRIVTKVKPKIVFAEGKNGRILNAVSQMVEEGKIEPILIGNTKSIHAKMEEMRLVHLKDVQIINPELSPYYDKFCNDYFIKRQRKGVSFSYAQEVIVQSNYFGSMLVKHGHVDGMITGATQTYPECIKPVMQIINEENKKFAGVIILVFKGRVLFLADCTLQIEPTAHELAEIAVNTTQLYKKIMLQDDPRVAFLSFSNFGSNRHEEARKVYQAVDIAKKMDPKLIADGEIQADVAVNELLLKRVFNFSNLDRSADILIFPNLSSANISYKLLVQMADTKPIGPILVPYSAPISIVQRTSTVSEIVNMASITALLGQNQKLKN